MPLDQIQRQQLQAQRRGLVRVTKPASVGAALKGWNTRDPFEAMDPLDAILLDNWYPDFAGLVTRNGSAVFINGLGTAAVQTLTSFTTGIIDKFLAASSGNIWDISGPAPVSLGAGFGNDIWQTATFNRHNFWVNGTDNAQIYDGTTLTTTGFTGVLTSTLAGIGVFNNRLYFWTGKDPTFWYGPVNGISGALNNFDLSMVSLTGGNLIAVEVLSYDGGQGIGAYTCFFMSSGEVLMYSGTDPSNPNDWALVGRYVIAPPVAARAITRYGGDIYLATADDHQQFSQLLIALKLGDTPPKTKVSGAAQLAYLAGRALPGWQAIYYPNGRRMIFNIPNPDGSFSQHIYNTSTKAWCRFRSQNAYCFGIYQGSLYFGASGGVVVRADLQTGGDSGNPILAQAQQAWQLFDSPLKKRVAAVRPVVQSQGISDFTFALGYDYQASGTAIPDSTITPGGSLIWGFRNWGTPSVWGGLGTTDPRWHIAGGAGAAIGFVLTGNALVPTTWIRTDFLIEPGSAL